MTFSGCGKHCSSTRSAALITARHGQLLRVARGMLSAWLLKGRSQCRTNIDASLSLGLRSSTCGIFFVQDVHPVPDALRTAWRPECFRHGNKPQSLRFKQTSRCSSSRRVSSSELTVVNHAPDSRPEEELKKTENVFTKDCKDGLHGVLMDRGVLHFQYQEPPSNLTGHGCVWSSAKSLLAHL